MRPTHRPKATNFPRNRSGFRCAWVVLIGALAGEAPRRALGDDVPPVSAEMATFFEAKVRPVLIEKCASCHGAEKQSGGLRVDSRAAMMEGGDLGPAVVPGDPDKSPLIQAIRHQGDNKMPPKGGKLPDPVAESLSHWVRLGAPWPSAVAPVDSSASKDEPARTHWSFQAVHDPALPSVENSAWVASPVDAFILNKLEAKRIKPSPPADKRTLIRRVTFDLTGLPPTAAEVDAFLADESPEAYRKVVDRLLASPRYGERWGRHWLDVARYADTKGYVGGDGERRFPYSYTYRDYVIRAFNDDLPYDRFIVEQIAADRLAPGEDRRNLAALGFLTVGRRFFGDNNDVIDDRIDVVTRGLLGLSVTCARCHDHKFDPIPTEDYYSLHGVFASSIEPGELPLLPTSASEADRISYNQERQKRLDVASEARAMFRAQVELELRDHLAAFVDAALALDFDPKHPKLDEVARAHQLSPERVRFTNRRLGKFLAKDGDSLDPIVGPWVRFAKIPDAEFAAKVAEVVKAIVDQPDPAHPVDPAVVALFAPPAEVPKSLLEVAGRYGRLLERAAKSFAPQPEVGPPSVVADPSLASLFQKISSGENALVVVGADVGDRVLNRLEREKVQKLDTKVAELDVSHPGSPARAMVLNDSEHPVTPHVAIRGNPNRPGKQVPRRFLKVLAPGGEAKPFTQGSGRLEMARSIASPDNPLTARVMVNRIWHEHFGSGLVLTPSDFGVRGELPSHPELLDYLARRFVEGGWSVKAIHRLILLSNTYQQRSDQRADGFEADPRNRLAWRFERRRVDFEAMRDAVLAVAGQLDPAMGGRSVDLFGNKPSSRRTVYGFIDRYDLDPTFRTFDFASPDISTPLRPSTTVPQQALFLLNSPFLLEEAKQLANRADLVAAPDLDARIARLYLDLFGRPPEKAEVDLGRRFVESSPRSDQGNAPSPWEMYAQVLLMSNEFSFID